MAFSSPVLWGLARGRIRNGNPDKGTETLIHLMMLSLLYRLEMVTPIRGRKLFPKSSPEAAARLKLEMVTPIRGRKRAVFVCQLYRSHLLEMVTPIRGRKPSASSSSNSSSTVSLEMITPIRGRKLN